MKHDFHAEATAPLWVATWLLGSFKYRVDACYSRAAARISTFLTGFPERSELLEVYNIQTRARLVSSGSRATWKQIRGLAVLQSSGQGPA